MKKIFSFKILFIISILFLSLNAEEFNNYKLIGNGYDGNSNLDSFQFPENIDLANIPSQYEDINYSYLNKALSNVKCINSEIDQSKYYSNLSSVDFSTGTYTCKYYLKETPDILSFIKTYTNNTYFEEERFFHNKKNASFDDLNFPKFEKYYGDYTLKKQYNTITSNVYTIDLDSLRKQYNKLVKDIKDGEYDFNSTDYVDSRKIDSHNFYTQTISAAYTGMITLDKRYFKSIEMVDNKGNINLKDFALFNENNKDENNLSNNYNENDLLYIKSGYKKLRDFMSISKDVNVLTAFSFIDKKLWGFYIYLMQNLQDAYLWIIYTLLFGGFVYKIGHGFYLVKTKKLDKKNIGYVAGGYLLLIFSFNVPVSFEPVSIPSKYIYTDITSNPTDNQMKAIEDFYYTSSIAKSTIRYFAEKGLVLANIVSDYSDFSFLKFLQSFSNFYDTKDLYDIKSSIIDLQRDSYNLYKNSLFYDNVCVPLYQNELKNYNRGNNYTSSIPLNNQDFSNLGINSIEFSTCINVKNDLKRQTAFNLASYQNIRRDIRKVQLLLDNEDSDDFQNKKNGFRNAINLLSFAQSKNGWINVASSPVIHNILVETKSFSNSYLEEKLNEEFKRTNLVDAYYNEEDKLDDLNNSEVSELFFGGLSSVTSYFILPGFGNYVFKTYETLSNKILGLNVQDYIPESVKDNKYTKKAKAKAKAAKNQISKLKKYTKKLINKIPVLRTIESADILLDKLLVVGKSAFIFATAFFIVLYLYMTMISSGTIIIVACVITFRILFYFVELLVYFFVSDGVALVSILAPKSSSVLRNFIGKGLVTLVFTPSLIVLSVYIYIFTLNVAKELYTMMIGNLYDMLIVMNSQIVGKQAAGYTWFNGFFQEISFQFKISAFKGIGTVLLDLFGVFFAVLVIISLKKWIFDVVGYKESDLADNLSNSIQNKLTNYTTPIK